ncbi:single-stranded DNA-binding protein [Sedimentibacter sp.]|uniref:single-stranded DNA-binding protein n=1 Tax=Sedimentibacter sp. TaxID=1960295 RepID=UPI0028979E4A|nr:single-stranded DNA-binding protein [Sedimentibacter sp.]
MPTVYELLDNAKAELSNLLSEEVFFLRDLFKGYEWNRISRSNRLLLGTLFLNYVKSENLFAVSIDKTSSGHRDMPKYDFIRRIKPC